jgi:hypothetical protein
MRDNQDMEAVAYCEKCGGEVYPRGIRIRHEGRLLCTSCFRMKVRRILWEEPDRIAAEMGLEVERYGQP